MLTNCVGVVDSGYRGEVSFHFRPHAEIANRVHADGSFSFSSWISTDTYKVGDRVGQIIIMPFPHIEFEEVEELSKTERGDQGHGSTGH